MALCGFQSGVIWDPSRSNWQNTAHRPIAWSAWYPAAGSQGQVPPQEGVFDHGDVVWNAPLASAQKFPVIVLSHGTGGTAESLGWLARALALQGYVVLGANHHGNTGVEPYCPEGFLCWWERASDLSILLSQLGARGVFRDRLDINRVAAVGFSLGGYTVLALAGAQTSLEAFDLWRRANGITQGGPKEFPDAAAHIPMLMETSVAFRTSWARHSTNFLDARIKSVVAIAPAPPIRSFVSKSVQDLRVPITLLTGGADQEAPTDQCADWLVSQNENIHHHGLGEHVGHYTFLGLPSDTSLIGKEDIFSDHPSVDRRHVHQRATKIVLGSLAKT